MKLKTKRQDEGVTEDTRKGEVLIRRRAVLVNQGNNCEHDGTSECYNMHMQLENSTLAQKDYETGNWKELKEEKKEAKTL